MFYPLGSLSTSTTENAQLLLDWWWLVALRGLAAILFGFMALALPSATFSILVIALAAACIVDGMANLAIAVQSMRAGLRWDTVALHGTVALALGLTIFWPHLAATTFVLLIGLWSILVGIIMLHLALFLSGGTRLWPLLFTGAASYAFGTFLVLQPMSGRLILTWGVGVSAILGGTALVATAYLIATEGGGVLGLRRRRGA